MSDSKEQWEFERWFCLQHGPRPGGNATTGDLIEEVRRSQYAYNKAVSELEARHRWEERRTSARYAWNLKDAEKKP